MTAKRRFTIITALLIGVLFLAGCGRNMFDQARLDPYQESQFFEDGMGMRPIPPNTVSRERGNIEPAFLTGLGTGGFVAEMPFELTEDVLMRGKERYDIYCAVCHNYNGDGKGIMVQRGFPQPFSFVDEQRLLMMPIGYYFNAATAGFGRMYSYASRISPEDRWAIAGYIKALQLSQNASIDDIPADILATLEVSSNE